MMCFLTWITSPLSRTYERLTYFPHKISPILLIVMKYHDKNDLNILHDGKTLKASHVGHTTLIFTLVSHRFGFWILIIRTLDTSHILHIILEHSKLWKLHTFFT